MILFNKFVKSQINKVNSILLKNDFIKQKFKYVNERNIEYSFLLKCLIDSEAVKILDVGTGTTSLPSLLRNCGYMVTAVDNISDYWPKGMFNCHYYVINDDIKNTSLTEKFDFITCISVLEHIKESESAVRSMFKLLKPGGRLVMTFPYNENIYVDNIYADERASYGKNAAYVCQVYSRKQVEMWLKTCSAKVLKQEYWQVFSGDFWTFGQRLKKPLMVDQNEKHQLSCIMLEKQ